MAHHCTFISLKRGIKIENYPVTNIASTSFVGIKILQRRLNAVLCSNVRVALKRTAHTFYARGQYLFTIALAYVLVSLLTPRETDSKTIPAYIFKQSKSS